jgi:CRP-like cAMP-binding protein
MPMNWKERVMNIFVLCLTLIVFSSFISSMTVAVTRMRNLHGSENKRFALLRKYFRNNDTPHDLRVRIQTFLEEKLLVLSSGSHERDVDLLPLLSKGLYSELIRVRQVPILRSYMIFRKLHSSEAADDLLALICEEACSQRVHGPGEKVYIVDEMSKGMYFLTKGDFELHEYREDDVKAFKISPLKSLTTSRPGAAPLPKEGWTPTTPLPSYNVGWLSEFALFEPRHHDTMLFARAYCEILQVSRTAFLPVIRKFPTLEEVLIETNLKRYEHAEFMMGDEENIGDWIRPQTKQNAVELRVTDSLTNSSTLSATMPAFTPLMAAPGA